MKLGRRDLFKFAAGSAAGVALTPVPWRLIEDAALWSQNWSWIPKVPRGEMRVKYTNCTLCPAGCGVRVRSVGEQPVSLAGVAKHPANQGALCALGLAGHHLPYHPARVTQVLRRGKPVTLEAAAAEIAAAVERIRQGGPQSVAVLDERPGRTASLLYRKLLAGLPNGVYLTPPAREGAATLGALGGLTDQDPGRLGLDLDRVRSILSFGAPVLDGWSAPGCVMRRREHIQVIQVETLESRTAALADVWVPIRPGTEAAFALGVAHVLIRENLYDQSAARKARDFAAYREVVESFSVQRAAAVTGISEDKIAEVARQVAGRRPALFLGGGDPGGGPLGRDEESAIAGLNLLLGSLERDGGIVHKRTTPAPGDWQKDVAPEQGIEDAPDGSIGLLFIDASAATDALPWSLVEKKLASGNALVVSFAAYRAGYAAKADLLIPAPMYLESLQDVPGPADAPVASFSLSAALVAPPPGVVEPVEFVSRVAGKPVVLADGLRQRAAAVYASGRGTLVCYGDGSSIAAAEVKSADAFWKALQEGAVWIDDPLPPVAQGSFALLGNQPEAPERLLRAGAGRLAAEQASEAQFPLVLMPYGWKGATGNTAAPPLMTKVYQESGLRRAGNQAAVHPATGAAFGLTHGCRGVIETHCGSCGVSVGFDAAVMPGVIQVAVGPGSSQTRSVLEVCDPESGCTWRIARARIRKV